MDTALFRQTFTISADGLVDNDDYEIIPCRISGADGYNNYQPIVAEGEEKTQIEDKLIQYSNELGSIDLRFRG